MRLKTTQPRANAPRQAKPRAISLPAPSRALKVLTATALAFAMVAGLANCAGGPSPGATLNDSLATVQTGSTKTNDEQDFDCGRLTGRMQVRILQIRDYSPTKKTSGLSRSLQGFSKGLFGGTSQGLNPDAQYHADVAQLTAQNKSLSSNGCKSFDLDKELKPNPSTHTPTPR